MHNEKGKDTNNVYGKNCKTVNNLTFMKISGAEYKTEPSSKMLNYDSTDIIE